MRRWTLTLITLALSACAGGSQVGSDNPDRQRYEAEFPVKYCRLLDTCGALEGSLQDCETLWTSMVKREAIEHECFSPAMINQCLFRIDVDEPLFEGCQGIVGTWPLPPECSPVTWEAPCQYL